MRSLLDNISKELLKELTALAHLRVFGPDEQIFTQGTDAAFLPIVRSGCVKMLKHLEQGKEMIIGVFGAGEMFAVPPVFDGKVYPATAVALERSELLLLDRASFLGLIRSSNEFSFEIIEWMCEMMREKTSTIQNLATASPEQRIRNVLLKLASNQGEAGPIRIKQKRREIAEMTGLTTETTIRVIRILAAKGMIEIVHGKVIVDPNGPLLSHLKQPH